MALRLMFHVSKVVERTMLIETRREDGQIERETMVVRDLVLSPMSREDAPTNGDAWYGRPVGVVQLMNVGADVGLVEGQAVEVEINPSN